eukprot:gene6058-4358_t
MQAWSSPRDAYPDSVHSLMALWGGFAPPTAFNDRGLEKRLQFDFRGASAALTAENVARVMAHADQEVQEHKQVGGMEAVTLTDSLVVLTASRLLVTSSSSVMLHGVLRPMLELFASRGLEVEWASFQRKNLISPWQSRCETSDIMAEEYAELKAAFPKGNSFLTGAVDGEHYFHYVFDDVKPEEGVAELDAQFNVYLYDAQQGMPEGPVKREQHLRPLADGAYEMQRVFADARCVSFETNASLDAFAPPHRLSALLREFCPKRFTLVMFQDKDVAEGKLRSAIRDVDGYKTVNRTVNYFSEGYAFHHISFEKA